MPRCHVTLVISDVVYRCSLFAVQTALRSSVSQSLHENVKDKSMLMKYNIRVPVTNYSPLDPSNAYTSQALLTLSNGSGIW